MITVHPRINLESNVSNSIFVTSVIDGDSGVFQISKIHFIVSIGFLCVYPFIFFWKMSWLPSHHKHPTIYFQNASSGKPATRKTKRRQAPQGKKVGMRWTHDDNPATQHNKGKTGANSAPDCPRCTPPQNIIDPICSASPKSLLRQCSKKKASSLSKSRLWRSTAKTRSTAGLEFCGK